MYMFSFLSERVKEGWSDFVFVFQSSEACPSEAHASRFACTALYRSLHTQDGDIRGRKLEDADLHLKVGRLVWR